MSVDSVRDKILQFNSGYGDDWQLWLTANPDDRLELFGKIMRKWQACRPNTMRRPRSTASHNPPYLDDVLTSAEPILDQCRSFVLGETPISADFCQILAHLWSTFSELSFGNRTKTGKAGGVSISKATLLLSFGRIGPAFDSKVRAQLGLRQIDTVNSWIEALVKVSEDVSAFESKNSLRLTCVVPDLGHLHAGRLYDMALGPR